MRFYKQKVYAATLILKSCIYITLLIVHNLILRKRKTGLNHTSIWIIGENYGDCIFDNGYTLFQHVLNQEGHENLYFVVKSRCYRKLSISDKHKKHLLIYGSFEHIKVLLRSTVIIFSHSPRDIIPPFLHSFVFRKQLKVYLKHGVFALKKATKDQLSFARAVDIFVAVSEWEKNIIAENFKIPKDNIRVLGLARFDKLSFHVNQPGQEVLYIPTWRHWINNYQTSNTTVDQMINLINDKDLHRCLYTHNTELVVKFHKSMPGLTELAKRNSISNHVRYASDHGNFVQELLQSASVMITDYSSVCWDFLYMQKPVIFYQFDRDLYINQTGSYINLKSFHLDHSHQNKPDVVKSLDKILSNKNANHKLITDRYFNFKDSLKLLSNI